jgi:glycosyltransferase involved in cell wall biosynthesis
MDVRYCVIIPTYNNDKTLERIICDVASITQDIIIVNDGCTDSTSTILKKFGYLRIISYSPNKGKGYAIRKGFELAYADGFNYAVTIDSDGQHYPSDIHILTGKIEEEPNAIIVGSRNLTLENISRGSSFANRFSNFWYRFLTGIKLPDTQTGFRLYPLDPLKHIRFFTNKYEFELEILVRAAWRGIKIVYAPVKVFYPPKTERISHFRPFKDFARISFLNTMFVFIAMFYIKPFSFLRNLTRAKIRDFINKNILLTEDSNLQIALAIALGIFTGILPVWGFQLILAIMLAHFFGLSKLITSVAANISLPPMIPILLYISYITGGYVMGTGSSLKFSTDLSVKSFDDNLLQYVVGSIVFAGILSIFVGVVSFMILKLFRKNKITNQ